MKNYEEQKFFHKNKAKTGSLYQVPLLTYFNFLNIYWMFIVIDTASHSCEFPRSVVKLSEVSTVDYEPH